MSINQRSDESSKMVAPLIAAAALSLAACVAVAAPTLETPKLRQRPVPTEKELRKTYPKVFEAIAFPDRLPKADAPLVAGYELDHDVLGGLGPFEGGPYQSTSQTTVDGPPIVLPDGYFSKVRDDGLVGSVRYLYRHRLHGRIQLQVYVQVAQRSVLDLYRVFLEDHALLHTAPVSAKSLKLDPIGDVSAMHTQPSSVHAGRYALRRVEFLRRNIRVRIDIDVPNITAGEPDLNSAVLSLAREIDGGIARAKQYDDLSESGLKPVIKSLKLQANVDEVLAGPEEEHPIVPESEDPKGRPIETHARLVNGSDASTHRQGAVVIVPETGGWNYIPGEETRHHLIVIHVVNRLGLVSTESLKVLAKKSPR